MKILFLLTQDLESPGGVGRYFPLAQGLAHLGHEVSIAALHSNYSSLSRKHYIQDGIDIDYVAQMHVLKQNNRKSYFPFPRLIEVTTHATIELVKRAWNSNADVIQLGKPHPMNGIAGLIVRFTRGKLVFLDCDDFETTNNRFSGAWQKVGVRFFETVIPRHVDYISTHNNFLRDYILKLGVNPNKIIYLPNGADFNRFANIDTSKVENIRADLGLEGKKVVVFIGSLSLPSHPIDILLDAFQLVHSTQPQTMLLVVGGGEQYDQLVARTRWLGLEQAVIFRGRVPGSEVPLYYKLADVSAEPVIDNPIGKSMLPLKLFESWVAGVPFVTQDVGDRRMILGDPPAGLITRAGDPNSLSQGIIRVLADRDLAEELRKRGFERAKMYSWENLARQMEAIYLKAISEKNVGTR